MKKPFWVLLAVVLCLALVVTHAAQSAAAPSPAQPVAKPTPGMEIAQTITTVTISPLLGKPRTDETLRSRIDRRLS